MHVIVTDNQVSIHIANNPHVAAVGMVDLNYLWKIEAFEAEFGVARPDRVVALNYEPERSLYVLTLKSETYGAPHEAQVFSEPVEHPMLNWIHNHLEELTRSAEYHGL